MEHHFVHRVSRLFPSSLTSCQFTSVPDVVDSSISITKTTKFIDIINGDQEQQPSSKFPKNPFLSKSQKPKISKNNHHHSKLTDNEGRRCPPVTPISVILASDKAKNEFNKINNSCSSNNGCWFSSEEEEGDFFSLSSCSSESFRLKTANSSRRFDYNTPEIGRCSSGISAKSKVSNKIPPKCFIREKRNLKRCEVVDYSTEIYYGKSCRKKTGENRGIRRSRKFENDDDRNIEESYAVEKSTNDPHGDFRTSMVEMIIEKQIFGVKELEKLLYCFISLNSPYYHKIIVEVFTEICDTLFSN
ncbi:hypothetical protein M9H77_19196 [Catharanthus roseus]|uniref:Uncharacterized protein n=1 Tax=Catharanthus roseus TaxID=4058 RepID=A0ACC0B9Q5_CATRO|nr:hypothetical protein M9H77_19196 [Catharanthus roseus]